MLLGMPSLAVAFLAIVPAPQDTRPFDVDHLLAMQRVGDPVLSPDGSQVAYTLTTTDVAANRRRSDVWVAQTDGSGTAQLTVDPANDWNPRWAPDGSAVYYLSARSGSAQVWKQPVASGDAVQVTDLALPVDHMAVFPDGERLLLAIEVYPDAGSLGASAARIAKDAASPVKARAYEDLLFRHWDGFEDGLRSHLFVWRAGGGEPRDLLAGRVMDVPDKPFGGFDDVAIAPGGNWVAFSSKALTHEKAWSTNSDLWLVPADGSAPPHSITAERPGADSAPSFSPDGRSLVFLSMPRAGYEADRRQIVLHDLETNAQTLVAPEWDRSPGELAWALDGSALFATADHRGTHALFAIGLNDNEVRTLVESGNAAAPRPLMRDVVFLHDTLVGPAEIVRASLDGSDVAPITAHNAERQKGIRFGEYEQFSFTGAKGTTVYGYVVKPVDFDGSKTYPFAFLIHGGPQGSFGDRFHYRWNPQTYAGAGYAAIMIDFRGSTGYGQAFTDAIRGDWGGAPFEDLMLGLDAALVRYPFLDRDRGAALGASYGGYMVNWIAGQAPDRFRCLVNHAGLLDTRMFGLDTEELWFPEWEFGGTPWSEGANHERHNPALHVAKWKAPMLVIHGAKDFRVVETQGFAAFTALQRQGIPSRLLHFPDENHWVLKPQNSALWHREVEAWLDRHTTPRVAR